MCGGDPADLCRALLHAVLGSGPDAMKSRRGSLTSFVKTTVPQASYPRAVRAWGFLALSANLATSELGLKVFLALLFPDSLAPWATGCLHVFLSSLLGLQVPYCPSHRLFREQIWGYLRTGALSPRQTGNLPCFHHQ